MAHLSRNAASTLQTTPLSGHCTHLLDPCHPGVDSTCSTATPPPAATALHNSSAAQVTRTMREGGLRRGYSPGEYYLGSDVASWQLLLLLCCGMFNCPVTSLSISCCQPELP